MIEVATEAFRSRVDARASASDTAISRSVSSRVFDRLGRPPLSSPPLIASRQAARSAASVGHDVKGMARASSTFRHEACIVCNIGIAIEYWYKCAYAS